MDTSLQQTCQEVSGVWTCSYQGDFLRMSMITDMIFLFLAVFVVGVVIFKRFF